MSVSRPFTKNLLAWYDQHKRDLPWRHTRDPYHIWVSEMMLQQTTVATVIDFYQRWLKTFPTVVLLAKAKLPAVLKAWQGLGYYNRARNFHKSANIVVKEYHGVLPKNPDLVRQLPGFGPYATASVLSIAYDIPLTLVDANVRRVMMRILAIDALADNKQDKGLHEVLSKLIDLKRAGDFNQALMEIGAMICKSKNPSCHACPVRKYCKAYTAGTQEIIPQVKKKIIQEIHAAIGVICHEGKYFIQQRTAKGLLVGLWEFPGGKIEKGETPKQAVIRELKEEINVDIVEATYLCALQHFYTQYKVNLSVWLCKCQALPKADTTHRWVSLKDLKKYPMPSGSAKILDFLQKG